MRGQVLLFGVMLLALACGQEPGRIQLGVLWPLDPEAPAEIYVGARVELGGGGTVDLERRGPERFGEPLAFDFPSVPNGLGHVLVIELFESSRAEAPLYVGRSRSFDLRAGETVSLEVPIQLARPPSSLPGDQAIAVDAPFPEVPGPNIRLLLRTDTGVRAELSNRPGFGVGSTLVDLEPSASTDCTVTEVRNQTCTYGVPWTLEACEEPICLREVFVRFFDTQGFRTPSVSTTVVIDQQAPRLSDLAVFYEAPPESPLSTVVPTAAAQGTRIRVAANFSEVVLPTPFEARLGASVLRFEPEGLEGASTVRYVAEAGAGQATGVYVPNLSAADRAGNVSPFSPTSPEIRVDVDVNVLEVEQSQVSFIRAPNKNPEAEDLGGFVVPAGPSFYGLGPADGLDPASFLPADTFRFRDGSKVALLRVWANRAQSLFLQAAAPEPDGRWSRARLQLANLDTPQVWVTGVDAAGNETAPQPIENAWYVATTAPSDRFGPEHQVASESWMGGPFDVDPVDAEPALASPDGLSVGAEAAWRWVRRFDDRSPGFSDMGLVYDAARRRLVTFGSGSDGDPWEWDGFGWQDATAPGPGPSPRSDVRGTYDSRRGRAVFYGGFGRERLADTWAWDGRSWSALGAGPAPARRAPVAYDSRRDRVVLFDGAELGDTWELDGDRGEWLDLTPTQSSTSPPARIGHGMVYDAGRGVVLLFGGSALEAGERVYFNDLWAWDGLEWKQLEPLEGPSPPPSSFISMAYDSTRELVYVYGRDPEPSRDVWATWAWDGRARRWARVTESGPGRRGQLAFHEARDELVLVAEEPGEQVTLPNGSTGIRFYRVAWILRDDTWVAARVRVPEAREGAALAWDRSRGRAVLFGGTIDGFEPPSDASTWLWNGQTWTTTTAVGPSTRGFAAMTYDGTREQIVLHGGEVDFAASDETWIFDDGGWREVATGSARRPSARVMHHMAFDEARGEIVLVGGANDSFASSSLTDTWIWNGSVWTEAQPSRQPPARSGGAMAFDPIRRALTLAGGSASADLPVGTRDVWAWDGRTWAASSTTAPARFGHRLLYDPVGESMVLLGGSEDEFDPGRQEIWVRRSGHWSRASTPELRPGNAFRSSFVWDPVNQAFLRFGGDREIFASEVDNETWHLFPPAGGVVQFAAQLPEDLSADRLTGLRARIFCGGAYAEDSTGAALYGWRTTAPLGAWQFLGMTSNELPGPTTGTLPPIELRASDDAELAKSLLGPDRRSYLQCRPAGPAAGGQGAVAMDYAELRWRYRVASVSEPP